MTNAAPTVFDEKTPSAHVPDSGNPVDDGNPDAPTLKALVGEGKKFKTNEDLAKSKLEADAFIDRLQEEKKELRKDLDARLRTEEAIEALNKKKEDQPPSKVDANDIQRIVKEALSQEERDKVAIGNIRQVNAHLIDKLGGKAEAEEFIAKKSEELGVPVDWLKDMAARSPKALYNTLGIDNPPAAPAPVVSAKSDVNTEAKKLNTAPKGNTKASYEELRKANPSAYWSTKVQKEIFEATKNGTYK